MPVPVVYTPIQPSPSVVMKPPIWVPNVWQGVMCPGTPPIPEIWSVTCTNFKPLIAPAPYNGDPGIILAFTPGTATTAGTGIATTGVLTGPVTATLNATGTYTDYLFPNKEYKYRRDVVSPTHLPTPVVSPSGYTAQYGTLNQGSALTRGTFLNPIGGLPIAGTPVTGLIAEIGTADHMQEYNPDPNFMIIVEYTLVITSSCGIGAGTFPIKQIVYDDKDIASTRFVNAVNSQTGRNPLFPKFLP